MRFHKDWIIHLWDSADKVQTQGKEDETVQRHEVPSPRLGGLRKAQTTQISSQERKCVQTLKGNLETWPMTS